MFAKLDAEFATHRAALHLRDLRQEVIASNIANADTPGYKARDFDFSQAMKDVMSAKQPAGALQMTVTDPRHISIGPRQSLEVALMYRNDVQPSIDGNTVDMNTEMANFADNALRYQASLSFAQQHIAGLRSALQSQ
jgi:flagellar basal-body rod protein FlgB